MTRARVVPRCIEFLDKMTLDVMREAGNSIDTRAGSLLLIEVDGVESECESQAERVAAACELSGALEVLVRDATPGKVAQVCGITEDALREAARLFATSPATLSLYCMGLNQSSSGTAKNTALINLHLATAQIGKPGAGPFSLTGQPNAMGGREVGGLSNLLPAHRDMANAAHRAEVAAMWGVADIPAVPGRSAPRTGPQPPQT